MGKKGGEGGRRESEGVGRGEGVRERARDEGGREGWINEKVGVGRRERG